MTDIETIIRHPVSWFVGSVVSVVSVVATFTGDPIHVLATLIEVIVANAGTVFTASSIAGFTLGPSILPSGIASAVEAIALVFGVILVVKILSSVWDRFKKRLEDD